MWTADHHRPLDADESPCAMASMDDSGQLLSVNEALMDLLQLDRSVLGQMRFDDLLAPPAKVFHLMVLSPMLRLKGRADEVALILRTRTGRDVHVLTSGVRRGTGAGSAVHLCFMPLDQRKQLEDELLRVRRAAEELPGVIFQLEFAANGVRRFIHIGEGMQRLMAVDSEDLRRDANPFFEAIHVGDRARVQAEMDAALEHMVGGQVEFRVVRDGAREEYWCEAHATPKRLPDGSVLWYGYLVDSTRQQAIAAQLREADKLRVTSLIAAGMAHDFNNLLGTINGLAELCLMQADEGTRLHRNLERIHASGQRAAVLVRQLLDYARQSPMHRERVTLAPWMAQCMPLLQLGLADDVTAELRLLSDGSVDADVVQLQQVLLNLVHNARDAMAGRSGSIVIELDRLPGRAGAEGLCISVSDQGSGISEADLAHVFQPFFTTKPVGQGTGLGLSSAHGIVTAHGGQLTVTSQCGVGTTFRIWLPLAAAVVEAE